MITREEKRQTLRNQNTEKTIHMDTDRSTAETVVSQPEDWPRVKRRQGRIVLVLSIQ